MGLSPKLLPPILELLPVSLAGTKEAVDTASIIEQVALDIQEVKNTLTTANVTQAHYVKAHCGVEDIFMAGNLVMLSTFNQHCEHKKKGEFQIAKLFLCWDGPYWVTKAFLESSSYILDTQNTPNKCPLYHPSELKCHTPNDDTHFPLQAHSNPGPILTKDSLKVHQIDSILNSKWHRHGYKYLVSWMGYGTKHHKWISGKYLKENKELDVWLENGGDGPVER